MVSLEMEKLKFPIGKFNPPQIIDRPLLQEWIYDISIFPESLQRRLQNHTNADLQKTYRPEGWTVAQVIHHCADSHMNSFIRFKLGLTEDTPTIKPYMEGKWAELPDVHEVPVQVSIQLLKALHQRWVSLLKNLDDQQWERTIFHPELDTTLTLASVAGLYSWHGRHHLAHIDLALNDS